MSPTFCPTSRDSFPPLAAAISAYVVSGGVVALLLPENVSVGVVGVWLLGLVVTGLAALLWANRRACKENERFSISAAQGDLFYSAFHANPGLLAITRISDGRHYDVNETWLKTLEFTREEAIGKTVLELGIWPTPDERAKVIEDMRKDGRVLGLPVELRTRTGRTVHVLFSAEPLMVDGDEAVLVQSQDITELVEAKKAADEATKVKSKFLASMSHELRTPMNAILGFAQMLIHLPGDKLSDQQRQYVDLILKSGDHLLDLINQLLDMEKIVRGKMELNIELTNAEQIIEDAVVAVQSMPKAKNIQINVVPAPEEHNTLILADHQRLRQILLNYLSNAVKYNAPDGDIRVSGMPTDNSLFRIAVSDSGPGLTPDELTKLFAPFERLGREAGTIEGTGLGLTICRELAEVMNGRVGVESTKGEGATFWVDLPRAP